MGMRRGSRWGGGEDQDGEERIEMGRRRGLRWGGGGEDRDGEEERIEMRPGRAGKTSSLQ